MILIVATHNAGKLREYSWKDRVHYYPLDYLEASVHAKYGLDGQLFHLQAALDADDAAKTFFEKLSYSNKSRHVLAIEDAKSPETRQKRIAKSVALFHEGKS